MLPFTPSYAMFTKSTWVWSTVAVISTFRPHDMVEDLLGVLELVDHLELQVDSLDPEAESALV